jgi:hypothetical protein
LNSLKKRIESYLAETGEDGVDLEMLSKGRKPQLYGEINKLILLYIVMCG